MKKFIYFKVLGLGLALVLFFAVATRHNPSTQFRVLSLGVVGYICWSLVYHFSHERVKFEVVMEYVLIGLFILLAFALMLGVV